MYSSANTLQNIALSLLEYVSGNLDQQFASYIDPNTMQHVFTFLGPILAFFTVAAGVIISVVFFLRHHLVSWFRKTSGMKLIAVGLILVSIVTCAIIIAYKLILQ
jgi:hypothetical protein